MSGPQDLTFEGADANRLAATCFGDRGADGRTPVLLLHGGGQTRHAWRGTARALAKAGFAAIALDQRGHGESDWPENKAYAFDDFGRDIDAVTVALRERFGAKPAIVGASLGGIAGLLCERDDISALVLVDVTPRLDPDGVARVQGFMGANMRDGFATLEDAAQSIAEYLPHRQPPGSLEGLSKNLRRGDDGRYRWHWDPAFLNGPRPINTDRERLQERLFAICRKLAVPTLLVRGRRSELVSQTAAEEFLELAPHARYVDVSGAGHMVAGDRNDAFTEAVVAFLADVIPISDGLRI